MLDQEKERTIGYHNQLNSLEKELNAESTNLKINVKRDKQENDRISRNLKEKEEELTRNDKSLKLEKELILKERESLDIKQKDLENKSL